MVLTSYREANETIIFYDIAMQDYQRIKCSRPDIMLNSVQL